MNGAIGRFTSTTERKYHLDDTGGNLLFLQAILESVSISKKHRVLDIGCGTGLLASYYKSITEAEIWATELSQELVATAKMNGIQCVHCPDGDLKELLGGFDLIYCKDVLPSIRDKLSFYQQIYSHLVGNGVFFTYLPDTADRNSKPLHKFISDGASVSKQCYLEIQDNISLLKSCGFSNIESRRISLGTVSLDEKYIARHWDGYFSSTDNSKNPEKRRTGLKEFSELVEAMSDEGIYAHYEFRRTFLTATK